jgi:hypothetical protein
MTDGRADGEVALSSHGRSPHCLDPTMEMNKFGRDVAFHEAVLSNFVLGLHKTSHVEGTKYSRKVMPPPPLEIFAGLPP